MSEWRIARSDTNYDDEPGARLRLVDVREYLDDGKPGSRFVATMTPEDAEATVRNRRELVTLVAGLIAHAYNPGSDSTGCRLCGRWKSNPEPPQEIPLSDFAQWDHGCLLKLVSRETRQEATRE